MRSICASLAVVSTVVCLLEDVVVQAINKLLGDKSNYQAKLQQNIVKVIRGCKESLDDGIDERLNELQKELLKKAYDEIADEIFRLREQHCFVDSSGMAFEAGFRLLMQRQTMDLQPRLFQWILRNISPQSPQTTICAKQ